MRAQPTPTADSQVTKAFMERDTGVFRYPLCIYTDNRKHFLEGVMPEYVKEKRIEHIAGPVYHAQTTGLAEINVKMMIYSLRKFVVEYPQFLQHWDDLVGIIEHSINVRFLKHYGFTPAQLYLGFNPRRSFFEDTGRDKLMRDWLSALDSDDWAARAEKEIDLNDVLDIDEREDRLERAVLNMEIHNAQLLERKLLLTRYTAPQVGDLVLYRRHQLDNTKGNKFEPRWSLPMRIRRIRNGGMSAELEDIRTGERVGKGYYSLDSLKIYVKRDEGYFGTGGQTGNLDSR